MLTLMTYLKMIKATKEFSSREVCRFQMYALSMQFGVSYAARATGATRKTVRYWRDRYLELGKGGLGNKSRVGQNHPLKMPADVEKAILTERKARGNPGARTIKNNLNLPYSAKTIHKVIKRHNLVKKVRTRYTKKKDMSAVRARYAPFEKLQMDIKYLNDISNQYEAWMKGIIPQYQITVRDYKTGMVFLGFTNYKDELSTAIFADYVIEYLKGLHYNTNNIIFQTDNGTEFVEPLHRTPTLFQTILQKHGAKHVLIPPKAPTFNSDVESFHNTIEQEFLDIDCFSTIIEFLIKAFIYQTYYNHIRRIRTRGNKSPVQLIAEYGIRIKASNLCFTPIFCDAFRDNFLANYSTGYFKGLPPTFLLPSFCHYALFKIAGISVGPPWALSGEG